jgi:glutathione reductase (NADPH)
VPQLGDLDLEAAGVEHGPGGVTVAGHMQSTTNPAVYAAGDAADTPALPLTPVAVIEGKVVASNMLKRAQTVPDYTGVPSVVFTVPELARVGMLEEEARTSDRTIDVRFTHTSDWYANMRIGETSAAVKIIVDTERDTFLGAHMFGPGYGELINIIGLAMKLGLTTRQITSMPAAYPSLGSDLGPLVKGS